MASLHQMDRRNPLEIPPQPPAAVGGELKVSLACPQCGAAGWVEWQDLRRGLRCPKCRCQFLLNRSGKLQSLADLPHVRYTCPRCKQSGSLPAMLAVRKAECTACKLPLVRGPDQRLHEIGEAQQMQQAALREAGKLAGGRSRQKHPTTDGRRLRRTRVAWMALLFAGLLGVAALAVGRLLDDSPESRVRKFADTCLAGDRNGALALMEDDAVQRVEFDRWQTRYFPSILDKHRPAGDAVEIDVRTLSETPETRVFRVTMTSPFIGKRAHQQHWQKSDGRWLFDAAATIRTHDRPPR